MILNWAAIFTSKGEQPAKIRTWDLFFQGDQFSRDKFSRGFIFGDDQILIISRELIFTVVRYAMFMSNDNSGGGSIL